MIDLDAKVNEVEAINETGLVIIPTPQLVQSECDEFDSEPITKLGEKALSQLVDCFPSNDQEPQVLLKVIALNTLYSTRINNIDIKPLTEHIVRLRIDGSIKRGDLSAVERIYRCEKMRMYYSFATKFCSWHNPRAFPIYDRYVDETLWAYRKQGALDRFPRQDLGNYEAFVGIVSAFRERYSLQQFTFRELDKFLWRIGERILSDREN